VLEAWSAKRGADFVVVALFSYHIFASPGGGRKIRARAPPWAAKVPRRRLQ